MFRERSIDGGEQISLWDATGDSFRYRSRLAAQVQTEVPPVISGAEPVAVEDIKVHGTALEGNLEGNAVARDVIVFFATQLR